MDGQTFRKPLALSLIVHFSLCLVLFIAVQRAGQRPFESPPLIIELEPLPPAKTQNERTKQVVQSNQGEKVAVAKPDAFLGQDNRVVDRETVSKIQNNAANPGKTKSQSAHPSIAQVPKAQAKGMIKDFAKLGVPILPPPGQRAKEEPRWADFTESFGAVPSDYVKGLKDSETTALNTREFVYYSYFQRIRSQLDRAWQTILKEKLVKIYRDGRFLASERDHTTRTLVTLNSQGEIKKIQLIEESGVIEVDDAAVKAFNKAGPFPNPPKEMVDREGQIQIRWDFILKT